MTTCPNCDGNHVEKRDAALVCRDCGSAFDPRMRAERPEDGREPDNDGLEPRKPPCKLVGEDGNVFSIIARVGRALKRDGQHDRAKEWYVEAAAQKSYDNVLALTFKYVEPY